MHNVKVVIAGSDRKIGAMVKALAVEVAGFQSVKGATKEFLAKNGFYVFGFPSELYAADFKKSVIKYLSGVATPTSD